MKTLLSDIIVISLFWCVSLSPAIAETSPNTITFDNQSGEFAIVKLVGPTKVEIEVPNGQDRTVNVEAGDYYLLGRYGIVPEKYKYTKGDPFEVAQSGRRYSVITITLHKVVDGNYDARPVSGKEYEKTNFDSPKIVKTQTGLEKPNLSGKFEDDGVKI